MGNYRVKHQCFGDDWIYGYADSIGEAIELENQCRDAGWLNCCIEKWDEMTGQWVRIN